MTSKGTIRLWDSSDGPKFEIQVPSASKVVIAWGYKQAAEKLAELGALDAEAVVRAACQSPGPYEF